MCITYIQIRRINYAILFIVLFLKYPEQIHKGYECNEYVSAGHFSCASK